MQPLSRKDNLQYMPRKKEFDEDLVLEKAMHTFWECGYENTTVRRLEKDMGINQFSIYSTFGSKRELFLQVLKKYKEYVQNNMLKDLSEKGGSLNDIREFLLAYGHSIRSGKNPNGCLMVNAGLESGTKDYDLGDCMRTYFDFIKLTFCSVLKNAKNNGELAENFDVEKNSSFLLVSTQGLSVYAKLYSEKEINEFVDSIMTSLK